MDRAGPLPPALFFGAIGLQLLLDFFIPIEDALPTIVRFVGPVLILAGVALTVIADRQFKRARTEVHPFRTPSTLVTGGAFRFSRNPMYLGLIVALIGVALVLASVVALVVPLVFAVFLAVRFVAHEERALAERFGDAYAEYAKRVRRWM